MVGHRLHGTSLLDGETEKARDHLERAAKLYDATADRATAETDTGVMGIGRGRPEKQPTEEDRKQVRTHTAMGTPQDIIGQLLGYSPKTLRKYFRRELTLSKHQANAEVAGYLFAAAK